MKRYILLCSLTVVLTMAAPIGLRAVPVAPGIEQFVEDEPSMTISDQTVSVNNAQGQTLEVVSLTGRKVMSVKIESPAQKIELNLPKGCYILKVGKVVRKVTVR